MSSNLYRVENPKLLLTRIFLLTKRFNHSLRCSSFLELHFIEIRDNLIILSTSIHLATINNWLVGIFIYLFLFLRLGLIGGVRVMSLSIDVDLYFFLKQIFPSLLHWWGRMLARGLIISWILRSKWYQSMMIKLSLLVASIVIRGFLILLGTRLAILLLKN